MKKIITLLSICLFALPVWAQKLVPSAVKQILVHTATWGLGGGSNGDIKVIAETGKWCSYLIDNYTYSMTDPNHKRQKSAPKFIAEVSPNLVNSLLNAIADPKPDITSTTFSITAQALITELMNGAKQPVKDMPDFPSLITQARVDAAIAKAVIPQNWMDAMLYCEVDVITTHNDTIKMSTRNICATKLPWTLRGMPTYDMAINNFAVAAMGKEDLPDRGELDISSLKESIFNYVDADSHDALIATFKWKSYYPQNLALFASHFTFTERYMGGNTYQFSVKTPVMPANAVIDGTIDMGSKRDIDALIVYAALIDQYFKSPNFVLKYYSNRPGGHIAFGFYTGQSPYISLRYLRKSLPVFARADSTKTITFYTSESDDSSNWIMVPGNNALLTYHSVTTPHGQTAPIYPPVDPKATWSTTSRTWYLFDVNGKVLSKGLGLL